VNSVTPFLLAYDTITDRASLYFDDQMLEYYEDDMEGPLVMECVENTIDDYMRNTKWCLESVGSRDAIIRTYRVIII